MNLIGYDDVNIHFGLPPQAFDFDVVAIDSEFFGQTKRKLHRPHGKFAALGCTTNGYDVYIITDESQVAEFYRLLEDGTHVYANAIYDIRQLRRYADIPRREKIRDVMLLEQIMYNGYYDSFSLQAMARRYLDVHLPKEEREKFEDGDAMTDEMFFYLACDVVATYFVDKAQQKIATENDMNLLNNIELPLMFSLMTQRGCTIDQDKWMKLAGEKGDEASALYNEAMEKYDISIRSNKQLIEFLEKHKIKTNTVNAKWLAQNAHRHPILEIVTKFRKPQKSASTYGAKWLEDVEEDGKIYTSFRQIGAVTGRFSSSSPNLQNIPVRTEPTYRECFVASEGCKIVVADWSSQEPRITAFFSQDERLISIFKSGKDIYCSVGREIFGVEFDKKDKRRKEMKALVLGLSYGMTKYGLKKKLDEYNPDHEYSEDYAQELIDAFFAAFPGVVDYINTVQEFVKEHGYVQTVFGRKMWINLLTPGWDRDAMNYPIQGTAGEAMKIATVQIDLEWTRRHGYNPIMLQVHDELVMECEDSANELAELVRSTMISVAEDIHTGIPADAEVGIGDSWAAKK